MSKRPRYWIDKHLTCTYNWLIRFTDAGGAYMGLNQWDVPVHGPKGHIILIPDMYRRVLICLISLLYLRNEQRIVLDQEYGLLRDAEGRERTKAEKAREIGLDSRTYEKRLASARKTLGRRIDSVEKSLAWCLSI